MHHEGGKHQGFYVVDKDTDFCGLIVGDCRVCHGTTLNLRGTVTGNLIIEDGAAVTVRGVVDGTVLNQGTVTVLGRVGSVRNLTPSAVSNIDARAVVGG